MNPAVAGGGGSISPQAPDVGPLRDILAVQYLRGYAALSVVVLHLSLQWYNIGHLNPFLTLRSGVDVFFVISGFVMVYSTGAGSRVTPVQFVKRRVARVVPLYWIVTAVTICVILIAPGLVKTTGTNLSHAIASFLFFPAYNPGARGYFPVVLLGWTLVYEMFFYICFALAIWLGRGRPLDVLVWISAMLIAAVAAGRIWAMPGAAGFYTDAVLLEFLFGGLVAIAWTNGRMPPSPFFWLVAAASVAALVFLPSLDDRWRAIRFGLPAMTLLFALLNAPMKFWPRLHRLGDISYSLYLSHFFLHSAYAQVWKRLSLSTGMPGYIFFMVLGMGVSILGGYLCWRFCEMPASAWAKNLLVGGASRPLSPSLSEPAVSMDGKDRKIHGDVR